MAAQGKTSPMMLTKQFFSELQEAGRPFRGDAAYCLISQNYFYGIQDATVTEALIRRLPLGILIRRQRCSQSNAGR